MSAEGQAIVAAAPNRQQDVPTEESEGGITLDRRSKNAAVCRWTIPQFSKLKQRTLWSKYFDVGGFDCRLLVYPSGDSQALPGYISIYLQITDPRGGSGNANKWDCFASYRLAVANQVDDSKSLPRDSWHRFSAKKKSHGWCDFIPSSVVLDPKQGFTVNDNVVVSAEILVLEESVSFTRELDPLSSAGAQGGPTGATTGTLVNGAVGSGYSGEVYSGKFTWRVHNFSLFRETIKTQKIMSPVFPAGECALRLSVYQSPVNNTEYLSMCLESKDTDKVAPTGGSGGGPTSERSCWCLFRMSVTCQVPGGKSLHRDSYGRFSADARSGDNTSLGWNDYMPLSEFVDESAGYVVDDTAVFSTTFHIIREAVSFNRLLDKATMVKGMGRPSKGKPALGQGEPYQGKFTWKIENFTKLKDLLKKRKITGICIKSKRFQVGGRDCRLIVYPRGQSQPPCHLSMFLEVTDGRATATDWSCFVSHRLAVINQRHEDRSVSKESQNRYSKAAKDWGWREFVTLTALFDLDAGFLVNDTVVFSAEVLLLKESTEIRELPPDTATPPPLPGTQRALPGPASGPPAPPPELLMLERNGSPAEQLNRVHFTWRIENFPVFRDIMETRKIFSKYFPAGGAGHGSGSGGVDLRIGVYESFDTLCVYLESSDSFGDNQDRNFWVKYRVAVLNQKHPELTEWKESAICTKTWNNSVLQFIKVSAMADHDAGYIVKDTLVLACEVLECCPWFEFGDLDVYGSDDGNSLSTDAEDDEGGVTDDDSDVHGLDEDDIIRSLLTRAGLTSSAIEAGPVTSLGDICSLQETLRDKLISDPCAAGAFLTSLRLALDDPVKLRRLLTPTSCTINGQHDSVSLLHVLVGIKALQPAVVDMVLDYMVTACRTDRRMRGSGGATSSSVLDSGGAGQDVRGIGGAVSGSSPPSSRSSTPATDLRMDISGAGPSASPPLSARHLPGAPSRGPMLPPRTPTQDIAVSSTGGPPVGSSCSAVPRGGPAAGVPVPPGAWSAIGTPAGPPRGGNRSRGSSTPSDAESDCTSTSSFQQLQAGSNGLALADGNAGTMEVLSLLVRWLASLDSPQGSGLARRDAVTPHSLPIVQKVGTLLADAPLELQADIIMLVPKLVSAAEHTAVAGALLGRLAEASREGPDVEAALRLPVLAALGRLSIDPAVAVKVLRAALEALPYLSESELPPAVGLILKLSSASATCRAAAVRAVRDRVKGTTALGSTAQGAPTGGPQGLSQAVSNGTLDALRLAMAQHPEIAAAMLHDMDAEAKNAKAQAPQLSNGNMEPGHVADMEMLLDLMSTTHLAAEAERVCEACVAKGLITAADIKAVIERRRMQCLVARAMAAQQHMVSAAGAQGIQQLAATNATSPVDMSCSGHRGFLMLPSPMLSSDDYPALIHLAQYLSGSKHPRVLEFVTPLFSTIFRLFGDDDGARERTLRTIVEQACTCGRATQTLAAATAAASAPAVSGRGARKGKGAGGAAPAAVSAATAAAAQSGTQPVSDASSLAMQQSALLISLLHEYPSYAPTCMQYTLEEAQKRAREVHTAAQRLREVEDSRSAAISELQVRLSRVEAERDTAQAQCRQMTGQMDSRTAEFRAELASQAHDRKELQEQLQQLEGQLEWLRGERDEEASARAKEKKDLTQRLRESEQSLARLKQQKRDDSKRSAKEKHALTERIAALESQVQGQVADLEKLQGTLTASKAAATDATAKVKQLEQARSQVTAQVQQLQQYVAKLEADRREQQALVSKLEAVANAVPAAGSSAAGSAVPSAVAEAVAVVSRGLGKMTMRELDSTAASLEAMMKQTRLLQAQHRRLEASSSASARSMPLTTATSLPPGHSALSGLGLSTGPAGPPGTLPSAESLSSVSSLSRMESGNAALSGAGPLGLGGLFYNSNGSAFVTHPAAPPGGAVSSAGGAPGSFAMGMNAHMQGGPGGPGSSGPPGQPSLGAGSNKPPATQRGALGMLPQGGYANGYLGGSSGLLNRSSHGPQPHGTHQMW